MEEIEIMKKFSIQKKQTKKEKYTIQPGIFYPSLHAEDLIKNIFWAGTKPTQCSWFCSKTLTPKRFGISTRKVIIDSKIF